MDAHAAVDVCDADAPLLPNGDGARKTRRQHSSTCNQTTAALLSLQLGWGLWLFPSAYARLGWVVAFGCQLALTLLTVWSGHMFQRLFEAVPGAAIMGDVGEKALGRPGRVAVYAIIYTLDATRCIILHLAASQSLVHVFASGAAPPLWQCGLWAALPALLLVQIRALSNLSSVFLTGTTCQLVAIAIVAATLLASPLPGAHTQLVATDVPATTQVVALLGMVYAFGGQFAFTEMIASMEKPAKFTQAIGTCTVIMTLLYGGLGAAGYWSQGEDVAELVIFSLGGGTWSRVAAACILVQALSQYIVNVNVWTHNLLVLLGRRFDWDRSRSARCSYEHRRGAWAAASVFVITYSYVVAMTVPYFSSLVGIVSGGTYLVCAYVLPCWFLLKLYGPTLPRWELALCHVVIPLAVVASCLGLGASVAELLAKIRAGGAGGWGPEGR